MFSAILVSRAFLALARLASFLKKTSFSGFRSLSNGHSLPARGAHRVNPPPYGRGLAIPYGLDGSC